MTAFLLEAALGKRYRFRPVQKTPLSRLRGGGVCLLVG